MTGIDAVDADLQGPVSPPRSNGEIVFEAPWERRVFGLAVALSRSGRFAWDDFRDRLIARLHEDETRPYWASWAAAFEDVLDVSASLPSAELDARHAFFRTRPHGHDHG